MIIRLLMILIWTNAVENSHFNGGSITWIPVYPDSNSTSVLITLTQSYSWVYPTVNCTTNIPTNGVSNLTCVGNCSTQDGFSSMIISTLTNCVSLSTSLNIVQSGRSINITLLENTYFWIGYRASAWRSLNNSISNQWSIVSLIDLRRRPDGLINTPPTSQITSPQYVIVNRTSLIKIPVSDVNSGDDLRCRWSSRNSSYDVDECAGVCTSPNVTTFANLTNCTLAFTGTSGGAWYAIALQVEDFYNTTSTSPMSSVSIQFLVYVLPSPNCSQLPVIIPLTGCLEVEVNVPVNFTLYIMNYCNRTIATVTDFISTADIHGMTISGLSNSTTNISLSYVILSWTPQSNQLGAQQFCAIAYTSEKVQSNQYCVTFTVITSKPCTTTTTSTTTSTTSITTDTSTTSTSTDTTVTSTTSETTTSETTTSATKTTSTSVTTKTTTATTATSTSSRSTTTTSETTTMTTSSTQTSTTTTTTQTTITSSTTHTTSTTSTSSSTTSQTTATTTSTHTTTTTTTTRTSSTTTTSISSSTTSQTTTTTTSTQTTSTTATTSTSFTTSTTTSVTTTTITSTTTTTTTTETTTTQTTTTVTTVTTETTTSATTTTETTTISSSSNGINIPLIVGLCILGLVVALGCSCFWLWYLHWLSKRRRRRPNKMKNDLQFEIDRLPVGENIAEMPTNEKTPKYMPSDNIEATRAASTTENKKTATPISVHVEKIPRITKQEDPLTKSNPKQDFAKEKSTLEKPIISQRPSVTVCFIKKSSSNTDILQNNESEQLTRNPFEPKQVTPRPSTKSHHIKLPKNKVAASFQVRPENVLELDDVQIRSRSNTNNLNIDKNPINAPSNKKASRNNSIDIIDSQKNQTPSTYINRHVFVKLKNVRNNQVSHTDYLNTNNDNSMRNRASSFGGTSVNRIKRMHKKGKSFDDHLTNYTSANNGVTVTFIKKDAVYI